MPTSPRPDQLRSVLLLSTFSLALILTQSGCPQGAELENPAAWAGRFGGGAAPSSGGSGMTGPVLDFSTITCAASLDKTTTADPPSVDFLNATCAKNFCHGPNFVVGLDLRPDAGFAQRLLDAPAMHGGIPCDDDVTMECVPAACPPAGSVKIIDSMDPTASWIFTKVNDVAMTCGGRMPDTRGLNADQTACLTEIVNATAALK